MNNPRLKLAARFVKSVQVFANRFSTWEKQAERQHGVMLNRSQIGPELHALVPEIGVPISGIVWLLIMNACLAFSGQYGISEQGELVLMSMFKGEADVLDEAFMSGDGVQLSSKTTHLLSQMSCDAWARRHGVA